MSVSGPVGGPPADPFGQRPATPVPVCYRHPDRETYVRCARCDRSICPNCMVSASVGFQCPECVQEGRRSTSLPRTVFGGRLAAREGLVSKGLLALIVVMFGLQSFVPGVTDRFLLFPLAVASGEWWRLLTAAFLHAGIVHLLFNAYALFLVGPAVEAAFGRARFLTLYLLAALGGSAATYLFGAPTQGSLGASGAIFGLFGAMFVAARRTGYDVRPIAALIVLNLVISFVVPGIDWRAHLGGLAAGAAVAAGFVAAHRARRPVLALAAAGAVLLVEVGMLVLRTGQLQGAGGIPVLG